MGQVHEEAKQLTGRSPLTPLRSKDGTGLLPLSGLVSVVSSVQLELLGRDPLFVCVGGVAGPTDEIHIIVSMLR